MNATVKMSKDVEFQDLVYVVKVNSHSGKFIQKYKKKSFCFLLTLCSFTFDS